MKSDLERAAKAKLEKYWKLTGEALAVVRVSPGADGSSVAEDFISMAKSYLADSKYFNEKGDVLTALAAASYAHAWLDAGARAGLFRVTIGKGRLFACDS